MPYLGQDGAKLLEKYEPNTRSKFSTNWSNKKVSTQSLYHQLNIGNDWSEIIALAQYADTYKKYYLSTP